MIKYPLLEIVKGKFESQPKEQTLIDRYVTSTKGATYYILKLTWETTQSKDGLTSL